MPNTKTIAINPDFFSVTRKNKTKKKKEKKSLLKEMKPNSIKKDLIAKIKAHQKEKEIEKKNIGEDDKKKKEDLEFANSLQDSIEYLESISKKVEKEKLEKKTKNFSQTSNSLQEIEIKPDSIPYSNMKNGSKPTYSEWKQTQKPQQEEVHKEPLQFKFNVGNSQIHNDSFDDRQKKLTEVKARFNMSPARDMSSVPSLVPSETSLPGVPTIVDLQSRKKPLKKKTRKIKRRLYLGKNKKTNSCGVLIKNKRTRKNIKKEITKLKTRSIGNIKKYLRKHNLMKIGSSIPDEVAREIYENAHLAGDVYNKNAEVLFHNYTHD